MDLAAIAPRSGRAGVPVEKLIFCEIHLGTYTPEGTADAAARFMPELAEAGYSAVEVMPIAAFPGARNWGYDGAAPFAAHADYGGPAGIARLIDAAHAAGLGVCVWTTNDENEIQSALAAGVDAVTSDFPDRVRAIGLRGR